MQVINCTCDLLELAHIKEPHIVLAKVSALEAQMRIITVSLIAVARTAESTSESMADSAD